MRRCVLAFSLLAVSSASYADTVYLRDGQTFHGQLIHATPDVAIVRIGDYQTSFDLSQIELIVDESEIILLKDGEVTVPNITEYSFPRGEMRDAGRRPVGTEPAEHTPAPAGAGARASLGPQEGRGSSVDDVSRAVSKGSYMLGGLWSFSSQGGDLYSGVDGDRLNVLTFSPSMSYFLWDNISVGIDVSYARIWAGDSSEDSFVLGPKIVLVIPTGGSVKPFLATALGANRVGVGAGSQSDSATGFTVRGGPGLLYFLNEHYAMALELGVRWDRFSIEGRDESISGNTAQLAVGFTGFVH